MIVLDCDNTLWKGVVGEDGVAGITIPAAWSRFQQFMVEQASQGVLLCLCSKNDESDVLDVFEQRPDMVLKRDHLVAWRINWEPKSENIRALAQELNVGLDSFIFLDDNPVECAEVQAGCPEVLTLRLPIDGDIAGFIEHVWAFDHLSVTSEDQQRTAMYKQEIERGRFQKQAMTIEEFLAGLDLQIQISEPAPTQISRVAQLTQRTNQFNFTTIRRTDGEILRLCGVGPGMPGGGGQRSVWRLRARRRDDLRRAGRLPGGRHVPAELPGAGPWGRAPHVQRAWGDRPAAAVVSGQRNLDLHPEEPAGAALPR